MTSSRAGLPVHLASAVATPETRRADPPLPQHDSALAAACDVSLVARQNTATQYIRVLHTGRARGCILAKWRQLADFVHESLAGMFNEVRVHVRHGTTTLFAALEVATGKVTDACHPRHTHAEFLAFLKQVAKAYPRVPLHVVADNYATHKHPAVQAWLAKHPRVRMHFTPTSGSWLNLVECSSESLPAKRSGAARSPRSR